jgi:predicted transcriptional regulator
MVGKCRPARRRVMATISLPLSEERLQKLQELAREARLPPEELLRAAVEEWLSRPKEDFTRAADYVLRQNAQLYQRLA